MYTALVAVLVRRDLWLWFTREVISSDIKELSHPGFLPLVFVVSLFLIFVIFALL